MRRARGYASFVDLSLQCSSRWASENHIRYTQNDIFQEDGSFKMSGKIYEHAVEVLELSSRQGPM